MSAEVRWLFCIVICLVVRGILSNAPFQRFEYKFSFKPPYLAQKDGKVPFWEYGGNAIASAQNVRVAPSLRSQKGAIWSKLKTNFQWWEVDILFRITGRGRIGADGLAFWFTQDKGAYDGDVFGSSDQWVGLGVFFDSFDNDNKHNNPYIMAEINDGTRRYDHLNDGGTQVIGGCLRDFRNKPFPTRAKIEYYMNTLTVMFHNGNTNNEADMEVCLRVEGVTLPSGGHFGLSAATGGLADDHDVLHFLTTSLYPPGASPQAQAPGLHAVSPEDHEKLAKEYADYQRKLDQQKEDYRKEHPVEDMDPDEYYESEGTRELRQIFSGQSQMFEQVRILSQKLDEVVGRQERTLSMLSSIQSGAIQPAQIVQTPGGQQQVIGDTIRRHEVDSVLNNQNTLLMLAREIRGYVTDVQSKSDSILNNQARAPTAQVQSVGYDMVSLVNELRDGINTVKRDTAATAQKLTAPPPSGPGGCPTTSCVSLPVFIVVAVAQLLCFLGYSLYRDNKEAQAKKFY